MPNQLLTDRQVANVLGISKASVWRWVAANKLPQPMRLSPGCTRWRAADIENFIAVAAAAV